MQGKNISPWIIHHEALDVVGLELVEELLVTARIVMYSGITVSDTFIYTTTSILVAHALKPIGDQARKNSLVRMLYSYISKPDGGNEILPSVFFYILLQFAMDNDAVNGVMIFIQ